MRRLLVALTLCVVVTTTRIPAASAHNWPDFYRYGTYTSRWDVQRVCCTVG